MDLESKIERKVALWAKQHKIMSAKFKVRSWPDRLFTLPNGGCVFIEFKRPGSAPRADQVVRIKQLRSQGQDVEVFDDADAAINWLRAKAGMEST